MRYSTWLVPLSATALLGLSVAGCGGGSGGPCAEAAADALRVCLDEFAAALAACYDETDAACEAGEKKTDKALSKLEKSLKACADDEFGSLSRDALVGRLQNSCSSEASSIAWRTYGGPQGAVWSGASADDKSCMATAHEAVSAMVDGSLTAINACLAGDNCDDMMLSADRQALAEGARNEVEEACEDLPGLIAVNPRTYVNRAAQQVDCITATGHADTGSLTLSCGPSNVDFDPPRGEYMQVVVDGDKWGTLCGDGTDYAFQVRLAPEGERLDRIIIGLAGGGVCAFEVDCVPRFENNPELFNALDDDAPEDAEGIASNDPEQSPFANWTKVYLPYCNQDVFAGGGVTEVLDDTDDIPGAFELPRFGAVNLRAAVRMVRDVIWKLMDEAGGDGFRPDEIIALFGGWSAGGYGTLYNYHWLLDDLLWPRTAAFPDAGGALDNGSQALGVRALGFVKIPLWGALPNLPPYCFVGDCALGPVNYEAFAPRLKQVPEQQMLIVSNPYDETQQGDAFFPDTVSWLNTMRQSYCDTKDLNGINYFYTSVSDESIHVVSIKQELWDGDPVDGEVMRDWFERAVTEPDTLQSRVEEADFTEAFPGVEPYPCEVAP